MASLVEVEIELSRFHATKRAAQKDTLQLRVDHERPSVGVHHDGGVFFRHSVRRQAFIGPTRQNGVVDQKHQEIQVLRRLNRTLQPRTGEKEG